MDDVDDMDDVGVNVCKFEGEMKEGENWGGEGGEEEEEIRKASKSLLKSLPFQVRAEQPFVVVTFESFTSPKLHPTYSSSQTSRAEPFFGVGGSQFGLDSNISTYTTLLPKWSSFKTLLIRFSVVIWQL